MQLRLLKDLCVSRAIPCSVFDLPRVIKHQELIRQLRTVAGDLRGRNVYIDDLQGKSRRLAFEAYRNLLSAGKWAGPR